METESDALPQRRGTLARLGVTLLNLVQPGLGLLRLGRTGPALGFLAAQPLGVGLLLLRYAVGPTMTYGGWLIVISITLIGLLAIFGCAIAMTWLSSRLIAPRRGWLWRWYGLIAAWLVIIVGTIPLTKASTTYYHSFWIPAASMEPALKVGDRLVAKMQGLGPLQRGDVVIVRNGKTQYVKRIAALPGDRIALASGQIILNGQLIAQREIAATTVDYDGHLTPARLLEERLPGEAKPHRIIDMAQTPQDDWQGVLLGRDQFVLLGDNRDNSLDSRFPQATGGLGTVSRNSIEGRALFRYWRQDDGDRTL